MGLPNSIDGIQPFVELRQGKLTTVFKGYQASLDRYVLLKILNRKYAKDEALVQRFENEARLMARVQCPQVVNVYAFGKDGGQVFFAAEYIEGYNLAELLQADIYEADRLPFNLAAYVILETVKGLHAAFSEGILHRDIKPSNILISHDGHVKITDFGFASLEATDDLEVRGTLAYLAPELILSEPPAQTSDLFSLGATFYEMLCGDPAFVGEYPRVIFDAVLHYDPITSLRANRTIPEELIDICSRLLEKEPTARYQTTDALIDDLEKYRLKYSDETGAQDLKSFLSHPEQFELPVLIKSDDLPAPEPVAIDATFGEGVPGDANRHRARSSKPAKSVHLAQSTWGMRVALVAVVPLVLIIVWLLGASTHKMDPADAGAAIPVDDTAATKTAVTEPASIPPASDPVEVPETSVSDAQKQLEPTDVADSHFDNPPDNYPDSAVDADTADVIEQGTDSTRTAGILPEESPVASDTTADLLNAESTGILEVTCIPWCTVFVDKDSIGSIPPVLKMPVPAGPHEIRLANPEFPEFRTQVEVPANQTEEVLVTLWSLVAKLDITVLPWAQVYLNQEYVGDTPFAEPLILDPGVHELMLKHPQLGVWQTELEVSEGEMLKRSYNLRELIQE